MNNIAQYISNEEDMKFPFLSYGVNDSWIYCKQKVVRIFERSLNKQSHSMCMQNMMQLAAVSQGQLWYCISTYYRNKHIYQPHITCIIIHETHVLLYVKKCQNSLKKKLQNQFLGADSKSILINDYSSKKY